MTTRTAITTTRPMTIGMSPWLVEIDRDLAEAGDREDVLDDDARRRAGRRTSTASTASAGPPALRSTCLKTTRLKPSPRLRSVRT